MKVFIISAKQVILTSLFLVFCVNVFSQKITIWKGGTPGQENNWNCPKNWSTSQVPDDFCNVVIPNVSTTTFAYPVIYKGDMEVNALFLEYGAYLTIEKEAQLVVFGNFEVISKDCLLVKGKLQLLSDGTTGLANQ